MDIDTYVRLTPAEKENVIVYIATHSLYSYSSVKATLGMLNGLQTGRKYQLQLSEAFAISFLLNTIAKDYEQASIKPMPGV